MAAISRASLLDDVRPTHVVKVQLKGEKTAGQPEWLTAAVCSAVHSERGVLKAIASRLGLAYETVRGVADWLDTKPLKAWWIPAIVKETGSLAILSALAQQCGCIVVQLPTVTNEAHAAVVARAGKAMAETGEVVTEVGQSLADGRLTAEERVRIKQQIADAHVALVALELTVESAA